VVPGRGRPGVGVSRTAGTCRASASPANARSNGGSSNCCRNQTNDVFGEREPRFPSARYPVPPPAGHWPGLFSNLIVLVGGRQLSPAARSSRVRSRRKIRRGRPTALPDFVLLFAGVLQAPHYRLPNDVPLQLGHGIIGEYGPSLRVEVPSVS
jgi:hypothetical protein